MSTPLSERERQVLEAVIDAYVQTAEPAASRTIAKRLGLGLSPATIRNTMSDLEEKGYLYHPHTSAGRIPTDIAYRVYVDSLMHPSAITRTQADQIREELSGERSAVDQLLYRAAQVLGVLTRELGVAVGPSLENAVLERLELIQISSERLLLVLTLKSGVMRTIFVEIPERLAADAVAQVAVVLNERLGAGLTVTIGGEHQSPQLAPFTLVTAPYRSGPFAGVIGVLGPTRMPYDKIVALVDHTSRLLGELLE